MPGQQRLDPAEVDERVAGVGLLDDAGDDVADAVLVLLEHHLALGLADPLQDDLLGGLRGDAAEVVLHHVGDGDLRGRNCSQSMIGSGSAGSAGSPSGTSGALLGPASSSSGSG